MAQQPATAATPAKPKPTKAERFKAVAEPRTSKAMDAIAKLRGITNKNNYESTPAQRAQILTALRGEIDALEQAFEGKKASGGFSLDAAPAPEKAPS